MNIFKNLGSSQTIFKNELVFSPDFMPGEILHRESEMREFALTLAPLMQTKRAASIVLHGAPGTGKTTLAKYVINQLKEATSRVHPIYVNCVEHGYRYAILGEIMYSFNRMISRRGRSGDELLSYMVEMIKKENKILLVVLDDIDMIVANEKNTILYDLLRMRENFGINCTVIAITNKENFVARLETRIRSSLLQSVLKLNAYTPYQLRDILNERAKIGLVSGSYDEHVIGLCAAFGAKNGGDARLAINALWLAGKEADKEEAKKILVLHVQKIKTAVQELLHEKKEMNLSKEESEVLVEIRKAGKIQSGMLYAKFKRFNERTVRNYLTKLEEFGFINSVQITSTEGNTRIFTAKR